jgi:hypothetical protein
VPQKCTAYYKEGEINLRSESYNGVAPKGGKGGKLPTDRTKYRPVYVWANRAQPNKVPGTDTDSYLSALANQRSPELQSLTRRIEGTRNEKD